MSFDPTVNIEVGSLIAAITGGLVIIWPIYNARMRRKKTREEWLNSQKTLRAMAGSNNIDNTLKQFVANSEGVIGQAIIQYSHNGGFDMKAGSPINMSWVYVQDEIRLKRFGNPIRMDRTTRKAVGGCFSDKACYVVRTNDWEPGEFRDWLVKHNVAGYFVNPIGLLREFNSSSKKQVEIIVTLWVELKTGSNLDELYTDSNFREYLRNGVTSIKNLYEDYRQKDFNRFI